MMPSPSRRFGLVVLVAVISSLLPSTTDGASAQTGCTSPKPVVRRENVNQGLPYGTAGLVKHKTTLVKLHLSMDECAQVLGGSSVKITSASLDVVVDGVLTTIPAIQIPSDPIATCCAGVPDSKGDPKFDVPASVFRPHVPGAIDVVFQARLAYTATTATGSTTGTLTHTFAQLYKDTQPFKILIVPFVGNDERTWWSGTDAEGRLLQSLQAAARFMPVRNSVCSPIQLLPQVPDSCGIQYEISGQKLNVESLGLVHNGLFVGTEVNFARIKDKLSDILRTHDTGNPSRSADFVMGAVVSEKSSSAVQGMAAMGGLESWFRLVADSSKTPSFSGGVAMQELLHNHLVRGALHDDDGNPGHSPSDQADGGKQVAHSLIDLTYLSDDRSVMKFSSSGWNNRNVLLEEQDWSCLMALRGGGGTGTSCGISVGGVAAAAGEVFQLSCTTDGTPAGTECDGHHTQGVETAQDATSGYTLAYRCSDDLADCGGHAVPVSFTSTHPTTTSDTGVIDSAAAWATDQPFTPDQIQRVELRKGDAVVWDADATQTPDGVVIKTRASRFQFRPLDDSGYDDATPALSRDGALAVWVRRSPPLTDCQPGFLPGTSHGRLVVERLADGANGQSECLSPAPRDPDVRPGNREVVFELGDDVVTKALDATTLTFASGIVRRYQCAPTGAVCSEGSQSDPVLRGPGREPEYSADGATIAFTVLQETGGDLASIPAEATTVGGLVPPRRLTLTPTADERNPTWLRAEEDAGELAYDRREAGSSLPPRVAIINTNSVAPQTTERILAAEGVSRPSGGDGFLAVEQGDAIKLLFPADGDLTAVTGPGTTAPSGANSPSIAFSGLGPIAFAAPGGGGSDVWVSTTTGDGTEFSIEAFDDGLEVLASAWGECPQTGVRQVIGFTISPTTSERVSEQNEPDRFRHTFHGTADLARLCGGASAIAGVSDDFAIGFSAGFTNTDAAPLLGSRSQAQTVAVNAPADGSVWLNSQTVTLDGAFYDPDEGGASHDASAGNLQYEWFLDPPGAAGPRSVGTTARVRLAPGLVPGEHRAELRVTDPTPGPGPANEIGLASAGGVVVAASTTFTVIEGVESALFQPATWQVPSNGVVTYTVDFLTENPANVATASVSEIRVPAEDRTVQLPSPVSALSIKVQDGLLVTKFDRVAFNRFFQDNGLIGKHVTLVLRGTFKDGRAYAAEDPLRPALQPA